MSKLDELLADKTASLDELLDAYEQQESRPRRWARLVDAAESAIEELKAVQAEYRKWRDNLPENIGGTTTVGLNWSGRVAFLEGSALVEKLDTVCEIDLEAASDAISEAAEAGLPLGFGRDDGARA